MLVTEDASIADLSGPDTERSAVVSLARGEIAWALPGALIEGLDRGSAFARCEVDTSHAACRHHSTRRSRWSVLRRKKTVSVKKEKDEDAEKNKTVSPTL